MTDWKLVEEILGAGTPVEVEVRGTSMYPALFSGEKVLLEPLKDKSAEAGKCYLTRSQGIYRLHRAKMENGSLTTRGDNLEFPDPVPEAWLGELISHKRTWKGKARRAIQGLQLLTAEKISFYLLMAFIALMGAAIFPWGETNKVQISDLLILFAGILACTSGLLPKHSSLISIAALPFAAWGLLSSFMNGRGHLPALGQLELALIPLLVAHIANSEEKILMLLRLWCASASALCAVALAGVALDYAGISNALAGMGGALGLSFRPKGISLSTNLLASLSLAPALLLLSAIGKDLFRKKLRALLLIALLAFFLLSFSRTLLALAFGTLFVFQWPKRANIALASALFALLALSVRYEWARPSGELAKPFSEGIRWTIQKQATEHFLKAPLFGIGPGEKVAATKGYNGPAGSPESWRSHNTALGLLATQGVPGLLTFFFFAFLVARTPSRDSRLSLTLKATLYAMLFDSLSVDSERFRHLWLLFGLCVAAYEVGKRSSRPKSAGQLEGSVSLPLPFGRK